MHPLKLIRTVFGRGESRVHWTPVARSSYKSSFRDYLDAETNSIKQSGTWKSERIITTPQSAFIGVTSRKDRVLNFCANNYLGLTTHPEVIAAAKMALDTHGAGLSSVRFICGTQDIHKELEQKIAKFHGREDAILYTSCFDANTGFFEALFGPDDVIIADELNHASVKDGIRLCTSRHHKYSHRNMEELEQILQSTVKSRFRLIVTDGVFSLDGNVAPLKTICDLAQRHNAFVFVDESHGTGFFGKTGRGAEEYTGTSGRCDFINSTLGKAMGGASGGYTTGSKQMIELLRNKSRSYLFSNTLPPPVVAAASKAFDLITESSELVERLSNNTRIFRTRMTEAGFNVLGDKDHPICPVLLGDAKLAYTFADNMLEEGIYVIAFGFPIVQKGKARIRVLLSAAHSTEDVDRAVDAFVRIGRRLKIIK